MGRWIRVDTTWSQSEWLAELEPAARLAWIELLCWVKAHGIAGQAKRPSPTAFARVTGVTRDAVTRMEEAAIKDGALLIKDGQWDVTGWGEYQQDATAAERQRRYRERQQQDTEQRDDRNVTRDVTAVTPTLTETPTTTTSVDGWPAKPRKMGGQYQYPSPFEEAWAIYPKRDGSDPKLGAYKAFRARVTSGDDPEDLIRAAEHYAKDVRRQDKEGTQFVQQAATFYGPSEPFREFIEPPSTNGRPLTKNERSRRMYGLPT